MDEFQMIDDYKGIQMSRTKKWFKNKTFDNTIPDSLYLTSVHEAAHAVVDTLLGKRVELVSVIPSVDDDEPDLGYNLISSRDMDLFNLLFWDDVTAVEWSFHDKTLSSLAGCMATSKLNQNLFMYEVLFNGGESDLKGVNYISKRKMEYSIKECEELVNNKYVWNTILKLATQLRWKKQIKGDVVRKLVKDTIPTEVFNELVDEYKYLPDWVMTWIDEFTCECTWYGVGEDLMDSSSNWGERDLPVSSTEYYEE